MSEPMVEMRASEAALPETIWRLVGSVEAAQRHRVAALLHVWQAEGPTQADRQEFAGDFRRTLAENLLYLEETACALRTLEDHGIVAMPLKGALLTARYYPHLGVRPQSDIDLLVRPSNRERAHDVLLQAGWREAVPRPFFAPHYHWVYSRNALLLELHWALKSPGTCSPDLERIWEHACVRTAEGVTFLEMAPDDLLSYLAVNKGAHHFSMLLDFVDLATVLNHTPPDWERFCRDVLHDRTAGPVWFGLAGAKELLNAPVPDEVLQTLCKPVYARWSVLLKTLLDVWGGPLHLSPERLFGPTGRIYEMFLEGRPSAILHMLRPLVFPSRTRVALLADGSYPRYYAGQLKRFLGQIVCP